MRLAVVESAPRGGLLHYAAQLAEGLASLGHETSLVTARDGELDAPPAGVRMRAVLPAAVRTPSEPPTGLAYLVRRAGIAGRVVAASLRTIAEAARGRYDTVLLVDDLSVAPAAAGALALTLLPRGPAIAAICHEPRPRSRRGGGGVPPPPGGGGGGRAGDTRGARGCTPPRRCCSACCALSTGAPTWCSCTGRRAAASSSIPGPLATST